MTCEHKSDNEVGRSKTQATLPLLNLTESMRFSYLNRVFFNYVHPIEGDLVECGVGWGRSLLLLCCLSRIENAGRRIWGFDSFEGFPKPTEADASERNPQQGEWRTDMASVFQMLQASGLDSEFLRTQLTMVKGFFSETLPKYTGDKIALLHADADLYQSYVDIYDHLFEKVVPGGVILFDEYMNTFEHSKWPGGKQAIDETFLKHCKLERDNFSGKYYAIKPL